MLVRVVAVQARLGRPLTLEEKLCVFRQQPDFVCLPEYFLLDENTRDYHRAALESRRQLDYLRSLSDQLATCLVAGTLVEAEGEALYNCAYLIDRGEILGRYRKRNPVPGELAAGICPGQDDLVAEVRGVRVGLMICGDVFDMANYERMAAGQADLIFIPTTSVFRPADSITRKRTRDRRYFLEGARLAGGYVVKVCGVGRIFGRPLQGRSLIAAPWGIIRRVGWYEEPYPRILSLVLDIDELRDFRRRYDRRVGSAATPTE
jgi:predicted amidohydrolase